MTYIDSDADISLNSYHGKAKKYCVVEGITSIEADAFSGCATLEELFLPKTVKHIKHNAFNGCLSLKKITVDKDNPKFFAVDNVLYDAEDNSIFYVPMAIEGTVTISDKVKSITSACFFNCFNLEKIVFTRDLDFLANMCFANCGALKEVENFELVTCKAEGLFKGCTSLKKIKITDKAKSIPKEIFESCENLEEIDLPSSIKCIEGAAFRNCKKLKIKNIDECKDLKAIHYDAFKNCREIESLDLSTLETIEWSAFENCVSLKSVKLGENLKNFSNFAFEGCSALNKVDLDEKNNMFYLRDGILFTKTTKGLVPYCVFKGIDKDLVIPEEFMEIPSGFFSGCEQLKKVVIPNWIKEISSCAFMNCKKLENIEIAPSVISIADYAFKNCSSLVNITLPESVEFIGNKVFSDCTSLSRVYVNNKKIQLEISWIGEFNSPLGFTYNAIKAFLRELPPIQISANLKKELLPYVSQIILDNTIAAPIKESWIKYIQSHLKVLYKQILETPDILSAITKEKLLTLTETKTLISMAMEEKNFESSSKLLEYQNNTFSQDDLLRATLGELIDDTDFIGSPEYNMKYIKTLWDLEKADDNEEIYNILGYKGNVIEVEVPYEIERATIEKIGEYALSPSQEGISEDIIQNRKSIKNITISEGIKTIGEGAFESCDSLEDITLPNSITNIGPYLFHNCNSLQSIGLPKKIIKTEDCFCLECSKLEEILFNDNLKIISNSSFKDCTSLREVNIPSNVELIEENAFENCKRLEKINFSEGLKKIGDFAFKNCESVTSLELPDSIEEIGKGVFYDMKELTSVKLPKNLKEFKGESIPVGDYTEMHIEIFKGCKLKRLVIPSGLETVGDYAFYKSTLNEIVIEEGVKTIGRMAFANTNFSMTVYLPSSLECIYDDAFFLSCAFTHVHEGSFAHEWCLEHGRSSFLVYY